MTSGLSRRVVDAVVFDWGGVITPSPFALVRGMGEEHEADEVLELVMGPYDRDTDHPWHRVERGELTLAEFGAYVAAETEARGIVLRRSGGGMMAEMVARPAVVDAIHRLRDQGYGTALLTNNARELAPLWRPLLPLEELFDVVIDSSEVGMRKPDPRIYRLVLSRLGVQAERTVLLDDAPGNVSGAVGVGMQAILVGEDFMAALAALDELLRPPHDASQAARDGVP
jgi:epoxide hydrolase-like predicted phosphatase